VAFVVQTGRRRARGDKGDKRSGRRGPGKPAGTGRVTPKASSRYTPPIPREQRTSPTWVPVLMFTLLLVGMAVIITNYLSLLPGGAKNWYLLAGLGLITAGFITSTRYR